MLMAHWIFLLWKLAEGGSYRFIYNPHIKFKYNQLIMGCEIILLHYIQLVGGYQIGE